MYFSAVASRFAVALAAVSGTAAGMGLNMLRRDMLLAGELGITPGELLSKQRSVHEIVMGRASQNLTAQYATVSAALLCCVLSC